MTTNVPGVAAREFATSQTHYLRAKLDFSMGSQPVKMGYLPNGAVVLRATVLVRTPFNAGTTNQVNVTTLVDTGGGVIAPISIAPVTISATGQFIDNGVFGPSGNYITNNAPVTAVLNLTGTPATTGEAYVVLEYSADN